MTHDNEHIAKNRKKRDAKHMRICFSTRPDTYATKLMLGLIVSLGVLLLLVHLPIIKPPFLISWHRQYYTNKISIESMPDVEKTPAMVGALITQHPENIEGKNAEKEGEGSDEDSSSSISTETSTPRPIGRVPSLQVVEFAQQMPEIIGGIGGYYLKIEYPDEARAADIQGRLILEFVVETDGHASGIKVLQSLHPLCDSAAVHALRTSRFIPGVHNGEKIPVKIRLPVRFQLVEPGTRTTLPEGS